MITLDVRDDLEYRINKIERVIDGDICQLRKTCFENVWIGHSQYGDFLYDFNKTRIISRKYSTIDDFKEYKVNDKSLKLTKVRDFVYIKESKDSYAELSFFIDEKGIISTPILCIINGDIRFISANDEYFSYDNFKEEIAKELLSNISKENDMEKIQLKLAYKHK